MILYFLFPMAMAPNVGHGLLIFEVPRHAQRRITVGRTIMDEWSARRRDSYLTICENHKRQTSMPRRDSNPQSQQASGCKAKPQTARPLGLSSKYLFSLKLYHRSQWSYGLRRGFAATRLRGLRVRIPSAAWMSVISVMCFQVEISAMGWSHVQRKPADCGVSSRQWSWILVNE
jgi:hypothetical protein